MRCLLQKDTVWAIKFANIDGHFLSYGEQFETTRGKQEQITSFCAENIEFMIEIYDEDWSGDTETINIRGSGKIVGSSERAFELEAGLVMRLMSGSSQCQ